MLKDYFIEESKKSFSDKEFKNPKKVNNNSKATEEHLNIIKSKETFFIDYINNLDKIIKLLHTLVTSYYKYEENPNINQSIINVLIV